MAHSLRFYVDGISFWVVFGQVFVLTQGPSWYKMYLSAKMDSNVRLSGRLAGHIMDLCLLPPFRSSGVLLVSFW